MERKTYLLSGHNVKDPPPKTSDVTKAIKSNHKATATWSREVQSQRQWIAKSSPKEVSSKIAFSLIKLVNNVTTKIFHKNIMEGIWSHIISIELYLSNNMHRVVISWSSWLSPSLSLGHQCLIVLAALASPEPDKFFLFIHGVLRAFWIFVSGN